MRFPEYLLRCNLLLRLISFVFKKRLMTSDADFVTINSGIKLVPRF